jgi:hypothetical protein
MRPLALICIAAVVGAVVTVAGSGPASAICIRKCTDILPSGYCSKYGACEEVLELAGGFKAVRSAKDCRRSQALLCDDDSCKLVCRPQSKK